MQDEETFVVVVAIVMATGLIGTALSSRAKHRRQHLALLQRALEGGNLDPQARQLLVAELVKPGPLGRLARALWADGKLLVALGWVGLFLSLGIIFSGERGAEEIGIPLALTSFGVLSVPFALRELDARRRATAR